MLQKLISVALMMIGLLGAARVAAQAQGDVAAAANAFAQAQRAEVNGQHARAAELYELADRIMPAPEALRNATRSWLAADRHVSAAIAAEELLRRYRQDATSRELAEEVLGRTQPVLGRLEVGCAEPCTLSINGLAIGTEPRATHVVYLEPGPHTLTARFAEGGIQSLRVDARAGEQKTAQVIVPPPLSKAAEPAPSLQDPAVPLVEAPESAVPDQAPQASARSGLAPVYFWVGLSATLAAGAVTVWSGLDLLQARDDFEADETPSRKAFEVGESKDLRTSILIGGTAALAVGTALLGVFTDFRGRKEQRAQISGQVGRARRRPALDIHADGRGGRLVLTGAF